jgi:hypothetical protein
MRTAWLILLASTGCTFVSPPEGDDPGAGNDDGDSGGVVEPGEEEPAARAACDPGDQALRLCVDFDGAIADRSGRAATVTAAGVATMDRDGEPAAMLGATSTMHVREAIELDIQNGLALDMWIRPNSYPTVGSRYWMLDNNQQYGASFTELGAVRCVLGYATLDGGLLPIDGKFHHVACTYDRRLLKVFVDGDVVRCAGLTAQIPTNGADGLALGANLAGTNDVPLYSDSFLGGLDNVRVWARADLDVCAAAGRKDCQTTCPLL